MGSSSSSSLRIYANPPTDAGSEQSRDAPIRLIVASPPNAPEAPPTLSGKGKRKINLIKYPKGSDFLKTAVRHAVKVGLSKVGPSYELTIAARYRPLPGVRIWSPDFLTVMLPPCPVWSVFSRLHLITAFAFRYILS